MSIEEVEKAMAGLANKEIGSGCSNAVILDAERRLEVNFPDSYRTFLRKYGWARLAHEDVQGLGEDVPSFLNVVETTLLERNSSQPNLPPYLIPLMNNGSGSYYCLDLSKEGSSRVVFWDHEIATARESVNDNFFSWLAQRISRLNQPPRPIDNSWMYQ